MKIRLPWIIGRPRKGDEARFEFVLLLGGEEVEVMVVLRSVAPLLLKAVVQGWAIKHGIRQRKVLARLYRQAEAVKEEYRPQSPTEE